MEDQSVIFGRFRAFFQNRMKLAEHQKDVPINIFPSGGKEKLSYMAGFGSIWLNPPKPHISLTTHGRKVVMGLI